MPMTVDGDLRWPLDVGPFAEVVALGRDELDAVVLAIGDQHPAVSEHGHPVRQVELAAGHAWRAPRSDQATIEVELVHARVAIAI